MLYWVYKEIVPLNEKDLRQCNKIHTSWIPRGIYHIYTYKNIETVGMPGKARMVQEAFVLATGRVLIKVHLDISWGQSFRERH